MQMAARHRQNVLPSLAVKARGHLPSQVAQANKLFSPTDTEVTMANRIMEAMEQAQKDGQGAIALDCHLINIASIKQAEVMVKKAEEIAAAA
jgi:malyl-CoA/(S)-citramalyl-CoA lyase